MEAGRAVVRNYSADSSHMVPNFSEMDLHVSSHPGEQAAANFQNGEIDQKSYETNMERISRDSKKITQGH